MAVPQGHALVQNDVDLDIQLVARMVCLQSLDLLDRSREAHGQVKEDVAVRSRSRGTGQVLDVCGSGTRPVEYDIEGEEQAAEGVQPPD